LVKLVYLQKLQGDLTSTLFLVELGGIMSSLCNGLLLVAGLFVAAFCFNIALRLHNADAIESDKSAARVGKSFFEAIRGRAKTVDDWLPDARVKAGMVYNKNDKRFEVSGRLSNEAFSRIFRRRT
jgi:hypothetical protein